jgi:uncharacterized protein YdiU (UPF0061 family)
MAGWLRVGYVQGNFNSDNCLVAGRTMDYGPFGFLEKYDLTWNMWVGGGEKFSFIHQPKAAYRNFGSFVKAMVPLLDQSDLEEAQRILTEFPSLCETAVNDMWRQKLGLQKWDKALFDEVQSLATSDPAVDYTIFWRELANAANLALDKQNPTAMLEPLRKAGCTDHWVDWLQQYADRLQREGQSGNAVADAMRKVSPKYVPREWMLVRAYEAAGKKDYSVVHELYQVLSRPFEEQLEFEEKYYRRAPEGSDRKPGVAFMS